MLMRGGPGPSRLTAGEEQKRRPVEGSHLCKIHRPWLGRTTPIEKKKCVGDKLGEGRAGTAVRGRQRRQKVRKGKALTKQKNITKNRQRE